MSYCRRRWEGGGQGVTERENSLAVEDFARYSEKAVQGAAAAGKEGDKE